MDSSVPQELRRTIQKLEEEVRTLERKVVRLDEVERKVEKLDEVLSDNPGYGREGLFVQIKGLREKQNIVEEIVEGFARTEAVRREQLASELAKRGRAINVMFAFISTVLSGFVVSGLVYFFLGG